MGQQRGNFTIGTLAKAAGVGVETIRFYQRRGLLTIPKRPYGGIRRYGDADVARLKFVKSGQKLGFTLDEITRLLSLDDDTGCNEAAALAARRLSDVRARLVDLVRAEAALSKLIDGCHAGGGNASCPVLGCCRSERFPMASMRPVSQQAGHPRIR